MKAMTACEAFAGMYDGQIMVSSGDHNVLINGETGDHLIGVFSIVSMDEDLTTPDMYVVTVVDATKHGQQPELLAALPADTIIIVDVNF